MLLLQTRPPPFSGWRRWFQWFWCAGCVSCGVLSSPAACAVSRVVRSVAVTKAHCRNHECRCSGYGDRRVPPTVDLYRTVKMVRTVATYSHVSLSAPRLCGQRLPLTPVQPKTLPWIPTTFYIYIMLIYGPVAVCEVFSLLPVFSPLIKIWKTQTEVAKFCKICFEKVVSLEISPSNQV